MQIPTFTLDDFNIGDEVVVGNFNEYRGTNGGLMPCRCNSANNPAHPCRTVIVGKGRKYLAVQMSGSKKPVNVSPGNIHDENFKRQVWPVDVAKQLYRMGFDVPTERQTQAFIDDCVESL